MIDKRFTRKWSYQDLRKAALTFKSIYEQRPIQNNDGGMKFPHMFGLWYLLRQLQPGLVIESGIWKGQGTWLIERALPEADIISIDLNLSRLEYKSSRAKYLTEDFSKIEWNIINQKQDVVLFFDDHQDAFERIKLGYKMGFRKFIFEDNYPENHGDCYSLKKVWGGTGFKSGQVLEGRKEKWGHQLARTFGLRAFGNVPANTKDRDFLTARLSEYSEFPPIFKLQETRWGDEWNGYDTPQAIFSLEKDEHLDLYLDEAQDYTWLCYCELK